MSGLPTSTAARLHRSGTCEWRTECGRFLFDGHYVWDRGMIQNRIRPSERRRVLGDASDVSSAQELIDRQLDGEAADVLLCETPCRGCGMAMVFNVRTHHWVCPGCKTVTPDRGDML